MRSYTQLTSEERYMLLKLRGQGHSNAFIACYMDRHPSTIGREIMRNSDNDGWYRVQRAHNRALARRSNSRKNKQFSSTDYRLVEAWLRKKFSPDQIAMQLLRDGKLSISHETIYRHIWRDKRNGGDLCTHLRWTLKKRNKRRNSRDSRGRLAGKRYIEERPAGAENASRIGHLEIDTVHGRGSNACIMTAVDRKSKYLWIVKMIDASVKEANRALNLIIDKAHGRILTMTADNGTEFHGYKEIEARTGVKFYFANPYHPWERGLNEQTNRWIRQYLPKGDSMRWVTQAECNAIAKNINMRPRRILGTKSPKEVYDGSQK